MVTECQEGHHWKSQVVLRWDKEKYFQVAVSVNHSKPSTSVSLALLIAFPCN